MLRPHCQRLDLNLKFDFDFAFALALAIWQFGMPLNIRLLNCSFLYFIKLK